MSVDRLKVLQMLSDGSIDAVTASRILNGEMDAPAASVEALEQPEHVEQIEVEIDEPVVEEVELDEAETVSAEKSPNIITIKIDDEPKSEPLPNKRLRVIVEGKPIQANLDITLPGNLFKMGTQISAYFNDAGEKTDWEDIDLSFDTDSQQVRIFTEQVA